MAGAVNPNVGDYVGKRQSDGAWLYIGAVNRTTREVQIGTFGGQLSPWLNETQARAQYSYTWGVQVAIPYMMGFGGTAQNPSYAYPLTKYEDEAHIPTERLGFRAAPPPRCECGSGSDELSGAHSHWCRRYLAP